MRIDQPILIHEDLLVEGVEYKLVFWYNPDTRKMVIVTIIDKRGNYITAGFPLVNVDDSEVDIVLESTKKIISCHQLMFGKKGER